MTILVKLKVLKRRLKGSSKLKTLLYNLFYHFYNFRFIGA